jgi:hypothetical protein
MSCSYDSATNLKEVENQEFLNEIPHQSLGRSSGKHWTNSKIANLTVFSRNILKINIVKNQVNPIEIKFI